jgi:PKD repeat protein
MAEKNGGGWIKTFLGMVGGLLSGAVVMYFSAWVDKAVKPAKPVPNFRVEHEGSTVRFQDLSPGYNGWWDFGDGTELWPTSAAQDSVTHKYGRPGDYSVKLSLTNLFGEENERTVPLHIEDAPVAKQPRVVSLNATPASGSGYAPAMYHITAKTENASMCILDLGDAKEPEVLTDGTATLDKYVTFQKPGDYVIDLRVINGTVTTHQSEVASVQDTPAGAVRVVLTALDAGTDLKVRTQPIMFNDAFRADVKGDVSPLSGREHAAASFTDKDRDWVIKDVQLKAANGKEVSLGGKTEAPMDGPALGFPNARNLRLQLSPDRHSVHLLGELARAPTGKTPGPLPTFTIEGAMTEELRKPDVRSVPVPAILLVPAIGKTTTEIVTLPSLPADWVNPQPRKLSLAVSDGAAVVAPNVPIPGRVQLTLQNRSCILTATPGKDKDNKDQVRLDLVLVQARAGVR